MNDDSDKNKDSGENKDSNEKKVVPLRNGKALEQRAMYLFRRLICVQARLLADIEGEFCSRIENTQMVDRFRCWRGLQLLMTEYSGTYISLMPKLQRARYKDYTTFDFWRALLTARAIPTFEDDDVVPCRSLEQIKMESDGLLYKLYCTQQLLLTDLESKCTTFFNKHPGVERGFTTWRGAMDDLRRFNEMHGNALVN